MVEHIQRVDREGERILAGASSAAGTTHHHHAGATAPRTATGWAMLTAGRCASDGRTATTPSAAAAASAAARVLVATTLRICGSSAFATPGEGAAHPQIDCERAGSIAVVARNEIAAGARIIEARAA